MTDLSEARAACEALPDEDGWTVVEYGDGDSLAIHSGDSQNRICFMATHGGSRAMWEKIQVWANFIALSRTALPAALARVEELEIANGFLEIERNDYRDTAYKLRADKDRLAARVKVLSEALTKIRDAKHSGPPHVWDPRCDACCLQDIARAALADGEA